MQSEPGQGSKQKINRFPWPTSEAIVKCAARPWSCAMSVHCWHSGQGRVCQCYSSVSCKFTWFCICTKAQSQSCQDISRSFIVESLDQHHHGHHGGDGHQLHDSHQVHLGGAEEICAQRDRLDNWFWFGSVSLTPVYLDKMKIKHNKFSSGDLSAPSALFSPVRLSDYR